VGDVISGAEPAQQLVRLSYIHTETVREIGRSDAFGLVHEHFRNAKSIDTRPVVCAGFSCDRSRSRRPSSRHASRVQPPEQPLNSPNK